MTEQFVNPITLSFHLLESYKKLLRTTLQFHGLQAADIESVLKTVQVDRGLYFSINRKYKPSVSFANFARDENLSPEFPGCFPKLGKLHSHQEKAIRAILDGSHTIISTGTGSGKTESFLIPIIDYCLKHPGEGVKALIIYPMNALANDQLRRLSKALEGTSLKFGTFIGSTPETEKDAVVEPMGANHLVYRNEIRANPPDILITNYVMLDWMLTRKKDLAIFEESADTLRYVVLDEIHTYRGNKATHLKYLLARFKANLKMGPVYIGTSATLRRAIGEQGKAINGIDDFIKPLLDAEEYILIEPEYETEQEVQPDPIPRQVFDAQDALDWDMSPNVEHGLRSIGYLTEKKYPNAYNEALASAFEDLRRNEFLVKVRKALIEKNAQSFGDLVSLLSGLFPAGKPIHSPERIVKAYLSAVSFYNHLNPSSPVLDYRLHLFVRNISGHLKMCIKCRHYHSGAQDFCQECGFPLFLVYKNDIRKCIGKVSGNRLKWSLYPESDDRKNFFYTLIEIVDDFPGDSMGFSHESHVTAEDIILNYDPYGKLRLTFMSGVNSDNVLEHSILLLDPRDDHEYLYQFIKALLTELPHNKKKILGFVDNREKATQYGMVLRHEFASGFFEEFLKLHYPHERRLDIEDTWQYLNGQIPDEEALDTVEKELFDDFALWYSIFVKTPLRRQGATTDHLALKFADEFSAAEREVLDVFLRERAFDLQFLSSKPGSYIRFRTHHAAQKKGIHLQSENKSDLPEYPSISLGDHAEEYGSLVKKYDGKSQDSLSDIIQQLISKDVIIESQTGDLKTQYYLNPKQVCFLFPVSVHETYQDIKDNLLLTAVTHSSEINDQDRRETERRFQEGEVNFVIATPTLEMGIDIGTLDVVLMAGVPPLPSNYAQRSGRAGRSEKSKFAISLAFCFESNNHDNYYFQHPKEIIDGEILPPSFNPRNIEVIAKHFNAFMFSSMLADESPYTKALPGFVGQYPVLKINKAVEVFNISPDEAKKLWNDFSNQAQRLMSDLMKGNTQLKLYTRGLFPDYNFRKDQVYTIPEGMSQNIESEKYSTSQTLENLAISSREPEMAYYKFVPGEELFMAGDAYTITPAGKYSEFKIAGEQPARSYVYIEASSKEGFAYSSKIRKKYDLIRKFVEPEHYQIQQGILGIAYHPECVIRFINTGKKEHDKTTQFSENGVDFAIGYEIKRKALILRFDRTVCSKESYHLSLTSALNREINERTGLDEGEIRVLTDVRPTKAQPSMEDKFIYIVFYDGTGNGNVPLQRVYEDFGELLEQVYRRLTSCAGEHNAGCTSGCYRCLRSYNLQQISHLVDKKTAIMFAGYLTGKNYFLPSISTPDSSPARPDLVFEISISGKIITLKSKNTYSEEYFDSQNQTIFNLVIKAILEEFTEGMTSLLIRAKQDYLVDAINHGGIMKNREDFARVQFNLLRFKHFMAEKG